MSFFLTRYESHFLSLVLPRLGVWPAPTAVLLPVEPFENPCRVPLSDTTQVNTMTSSILSIQEQIKAIHHFFLFMIFLGNLPVIRPVSGEAALTDWGPNLRISERDPICVLPCLSGILQVYVEEATEADRKANKCRMNWTTLDNGNLTIYIYCHLVSARNTNKSAHMDTHGLF